MAPCEAMLVSLIVVTCLFLLEYTNLIWIVQTPVPSGTCAPGLRCLLDELKLVYPTPNTPLSMDQLPVRQLSTLERVVTGCECQHKAPPGATKHLIALALANKNLCIISALPAAIKCFACMHICCAVENSEGGLLQVIAYSLGSGLPSGR